MPRTATSDVMQRLVGDAVRRARRESALTQAELAERLGVSPAYVTNLEAGRSNVTVGQLGNVAAALGAQVRLDLELASVPLLATPE